MSGNKSVNALGGSFFICWITLHQLKFFRSAITKRKKKTWTPFIVSFEIIIFMVFSDEAKNEQFCGGVRQNPFFFLKSQFFRSAGNVIQQIKMSRLGYKKKSSD